MRKHTRAEIGDAIVHQNARAHRPARDHATAGEDALVMRPGAQLPYELPALGVEAIRIAVVRADEDLSVRHGGCQADGRVCEKGPDIFSAGQIAANDASIDRGAKEHLPAADRDVEDIVKADAVEEFVPLDDAPVFTRPGHLRCGR